MTNYEIVVNQSVFATMHKILELCVIIILTYSMCIIHHVANGFSPIRECRHIRRYMFLSGIETIATALVGSIIGYWNSII